MGAIADTSILVYRFDPRDRRKQQIARELLREGAANGSIVLAHQSIVEFVSAVTRPLRQYPRLMSLEHAARETEDLILQFEILYPNAEVIHNALRGAATYQLSWYDALIWSYAETFDLTEIISEDFQHRRNYGSVRILDPFQ